MNMIRKFYYHLIKLRRSYIEASFTQRYHVAKQRVENPACWPNQVCNYVSALEGISRALAIEYLVQDEKGLNVAYAEVARKTAAQIIEQFICPKILKTPQELLGDHWEIVQYAEKYRNLLIHESTFLRQGYAVQLVDGCKEAMKKLEALRCGE